MNDIRTVLSDLDGTLIDSIDLILTSYHHTMAAHVLPPVSDADWLAIVPERPKSHCHRSNCIQRAPDIGKR